MIKNRYFIFILSLFIIAFQITIVSAAPDDIVVFTNKKVAASNITAKQLEQIFLKKMTAWPKSGKVVPYNLSSGSAQRTAFQKIVLKKSPAEMKNYWVKKRIEGKEKQPQAKKSPLMVQMMVSRTKGAIGYCFSKDVKAALKAKLKFIKIDGKDSLK